MPKRDVRNVADHEGETTMEKAQQTPRAPRVELDVTAELIERAITRNSSHCMIAEAVKVAVPGAGAIWVDLQTIRFTDPEKRLRCTYLTPRSAQRAIIDFDEGKRPQPFRVALQEWHVAPMGGKTPPTSPISCRLAFGGRTLRR